MRIPSWPLALVIAAFLATGCGERQQTSGEPLEDVIDRLYVTDEIEGAKLFAELARRSQSEPAVVERLIAHLRNERPSQIHETIDFHVDLSEHGDDAEARVLALREVARIMALRLQAYGYPAGSFNQRDVEGFIRMDIPRQDFSSVPAAERPEVERTFVATLIRRLTAPGTAELLLEVVPPADGLTPPSLWTGSREAFDEYVGAEMKRMDEAIAKDERFRSSREDFVLASLRPASADDAPGRVLLLRAPEASQRFTRADFRIASAVNTRTDDLVLELRFAPGRLEDLASWSSAHRGRRVAFVVDGAAETLLTIGEPLGASVTLPLGPRSDPRTQVWLRGMLTGLEPGRLRYATRGKPVREVPLDRLTPIMRALVEVGAPAAEALVALQAEGGNIGARARRTLELIGRGKVK
ncbi:MAG: hypothetical protein QNJ90_07560 [Planctomycetota bacterium]|nr:hypothetical protein [Planctomycetota bacterium]